MRSLILFLAGFSPLIIGSCGIYLKAKNPQPTELTCKEYLEHGSDAYWVKLKNCDVYYERYVTTFKDRRKSDYSDPNQKWYVTVGAEYPDEVKLLLEVHDKETISLLKNLHTLSWRSREAEGSTPELREFLVKNAGRLEPKNITIMGLLGSGIDKERWALDGSKMRLAPHYKILDQEKEPSLFFGILFLGLGVALILYGSGWNPRRSK